MQEPISEQAGDAAVVGRAEPDGDLVRLAVVAFLIAVEQPDDLLRAVAVLARPVRARDATGAQLGLHLLGCQRLACW